MLIFGLSNPNTDQKKNKDCPKGQSLFLVGVSGFEPEASWTRTKRDTKLRHTPIANVLYLKILLLSSIESNYAGIISKVNRMLYCEVTRLGYKIIYDHQSRRGFYKRKYDPNRQKIAIYLAALMILTGSLIRPVRDKIKQYILPGDWAVTESAFDTMIHNIKNGETLYDATAAFCQEIIDAGKAS